MCSVAAYDVIAKSSLIRKLRSSHYVELPVDEYSMTWTDAIRAEADSLDHQAVPRPSDEFHKFGTLGRALWRERSLAWILGHTSVRQDDAQKIVCDLRAASLPVERGSRTFAVRSID